MMASLLRLSLLAALILPGPAGAQSPAPVLLVHGTWSDCGTWASVARDLEARGVREAPTLVYRSGELRGDVHLGCTSSLVALPLPEESALLERVIEPLRESAVFARLTFRDASGQSFDLQGRQVADAVARLREWTGAPKVVVVGHSMGGLAARAYVQSSLYRGDVAAVVTVATPHGGTALGDLQGRDLPFSCRLVRFLSSGRLDDFAVRNQLPDSRELQQLNQGLGPYGAAPRGLRIHAIIATYTPDGDDDGCLPAYRGGLVAWTGRLTGDLRILESQGFPGLVVSTGVASLHSDGVVPLVAQHPAIAAALAEADITWDHVRGFHSDLLDDEAPRSTLVGRILELTEDARRGDPIADDVPASFQGRSVDLQGSVEVASTEVRFMLWDSEVIDGDRVSLVVNGSVVARNVELTGTRHGVPVTLRPGPNLVLLVAENVGSRPPNTAALAVDDGTSAPQTLVLRADLQTSAAYRVVVRGR